MKLKEKNNLLFQNYNINISKLPHCKHQSYSVELLTHRGCLTGTTYVELAP